MIIGSIVLKYLASIAILSVILLSGELTWLVGFAFVWLIIPALVFWAYRRRTVNLSNAWVDGLSFPGDVLVAALGGLIAFEVGSKWIFLLIMCIWIAGVYVRRRGIGTLTKQY